VDNHFADVNQLVSHAFYSIAQRDVTHPREHALVAARSLPAVVVGAAGDSLSRG
jgi:hypothetical protein